LVLFPVTSLRVATKAVEAMLQELRQRGTQRDWLNHMHTRQQLYDLLRYEEYEREDRTFGATDGEKPLS
jgi:methylisocitrate lyase